MWKLLVQITAGVLALFLADRFISGVTLEIIPGRSGIFGFQFTQYWQILIVSGASLGLLNYFIKPILKIVTFPLRLITLGLFTLVINTLIVFIADVIFPELKIQGLVPLLLTSLVVWLLAFLLPKWLPSKKSGIK